VLAVHAAHQVSNMMVSQLNSPSAFKLLSAGLFSRRETRPASDPRLKWEADFRQAAATLEQRRDCNFLTKIARTNPVNRPSEATSSIVRPELLRRKTMLDNETLHLISFFQATFHLSYVETNLAKYLKRYDPQIKLVCGKHLT
jgi:hypothetical protein